MTDPFVQVLAPGGERMNGRPVTRHAHTSTSYRPEFTGEEFIEAFLNPEARWCLEHKDPECLCDVDTSKTEGMVFDKAPDQLLNVETPEDLVRAAANIWLQYDVMRNSDRGYTYHWLDDPEVVEEVKRRIRSGCSYETFQREMGIDLDDHLFTALRKVLNIPSRRTLNMQLLREVHAEGLSLREIAERIEAIEGHLFKTSTISYALKRMDLKPNYAQRAGGRPAGYKADSGLGYREWRERYGET